MPFDKKWYSHKFHGPGIRYEIAINIKTGDIVSYHGPFPCGQFPDIKIFHSLLRKNLDPREYVIADRGYRGDIKVIMPDHSRGDRRKFKEQNIIRARHESVNGRLKSWGCMKQRYRHNRNKHHLVF